MSLEQHARSAADQRDALAQIHECAQLHPVLLGERSLRVSIHQRLEALLGGGRQFQVRQITDVLSGGFDGLRHGSTVQELVRWEVPNRPGPSRGRLLRSDSLCIPVGVRFTAPGAIGSSRRDWRSEDRLFRCLRMMVEGDREGWALYTGREEIREILRVALQTTTAREEATQTVNLLGSRGFMDFRDLLSE